MVLGAGGTVVGAEDLFAMPTRSAFARGSAFPAVTLAAGVSTLALAAALAMAASLALSALTLGAASIGTPRCTTAALLVVPNLSGANVVSVTVSALPSSCGSATIQATVDNGSVASSGSTTVPAGGGSVTVTLASAVAARTIEQLDIIVTGP